MDFEDRGIENDPKVNSDVDTLKQNNEPIISFSPQRCRFDSGQSASQKSSSSLADLQLDDHSPSDTQKHLTLSSSSSNHANHSNSIINNLQSSTSTIPATAGTAPGAIIVPKNLSLQQHYNNASSSLNHSQQSSLFTNAQSSNLSFLPNHHQQTPSLPSYHSSASVQSTTLSALPINTFPSATLNLATTANIVAGSSNNKNSNNNSNSSATRATRIPSTASAVESNSISLMVNGAVLSANANTTSATSTPSTLDLQKRLEKRIAQATAAASTSSSAPSSALVSKTIVSDSTSSMASDNIISPSCSSSSTRITNSNAIIANSENNGNQINFSPQNASASPFFPSSVASSVIPSMWESSSPSNPPASAINMDLLWESDSSKLVPTSKASEEPSNATVDGLMANHQNPSAPNAPSCSAALLIDEVDLSANDEDEKENATVKSSLTKSEAATTSASSTNVTTATTKTSTTPAPVASSTSNEKGGITIGSVTNKSRKAKGSQSLRSGNAANVTTTTVVASSSSSMSSSAISAVPPTSVITAGFDIRKVSALLPPQRLAIPSKPNPQLQSSHSKLTSGGSGRGNIIKPVTTTSVPVLSSPAATTNVNRNSGTNSCNNSINSNNNNNNETTTVTFTSPQFGKNPCSISASSTTAPSTLTSATANMKTCTRKTSISETSCNNNGGDGSGGGGGSSVTVQPSGNGSIKAGSNSSKLSAEKKPLVQWDSDESEEELSFFPPSKRGVITDNLSIDNMSLSGEEDDLHLTPPRPLAKKCPCDPRSWLERNGISLCQHHGEPTRSISQKTCVIS